MVNSLILLVLSGILRKSICTVSTTYAPGKACVLPHQDPAPGLGWGLSRGSTVSQEPGYQLQFPFPPPAPRG